jgi:chromosome segregation ATPase
MNLFTKKADELAAELKTANETIFNLTAKLEAAGTEKTDLEAKLNDLQGKLDATNQEAADLKGKVEAVPAKIEEKAAEKAVEIVAKAGVEPVTGLIQSDSDKEPANAAEYIAALAKLEGEAADIFVAKYRQQIFGA